MSAIRWTEICTRKHTSTVDTFYSSQESARKGKNTTSVSQKISRHCVEVNSRIVELECKIRCPVIANGTYFKSTNISRYILGHLWTYQVSDAIFLFLKSNEHTGKDVQQNTTDSAQRTTAQFVSLWEIRQMQSSWRHCTYEGVHRATF